ncbi:hypothetical protein [Halobaculum marinum]|uniref:Nucleotide-diphospho-sugar transferase n=1 Tax=Halobaculum marinum TaxID=3031996 RepID=A0ABD5WXS3_9EURY|nr:hypothetical protein [Halobaculum sp. DT55]
MDDLAFVFASGSGQVGTQSRHLIRSIRRHHAEAPVYVYVPAEELDDMNETVREELAANATILEGSIPIPEYPISTKIAALKAAERVADAAYLLMLDTDVLVLDEIEAHRDEDADLYLKPVDVGNQFWGRERSHDRWRALYERYDLLFPERRVESTFDGREMLPYWNAGFVLTRVDDFGTEWLEVTEALHGEIPYDRHADQVALGLLSERYATETVDNRYNYPIHLRLRCPPDVRVLHYHNAPNLVKVSDQGIRDQIRAVGLGDAIDLPAGERVRLLADGVQNYVRRRTLPIDETHALERAYLKARSLV